MSPYLWRDFLRQPYRFFSKLRRKENTKKEALHVMGNLLFRKRGYKTKNLSQIEDNSQYLQRIHEKIEELSSTYRIDSKETISLYGGPGNLLILEMLLESLRPVEVIESGVGAGWSSLLFLEIFSKVDFLKAVHSLDRPPLLFETKDIGPIVPNELRRKWKIYRGVNKDTLPRLLGRSFDGPVLVFYDSDKSYYGRRWAYRTILESIPSGSCLVSDDILDNLAWFDFCVENKLQSWILPFDDMKTGFILKGIGEEENFPNTLKVTFNDLRVEYSKSERTSKKSSYYRAGG